MVIQQTTRMTATRAAVSPTSVSGNGVGPDTGARACVERRAVAVPEWMMVSSGISEVCMVGRVPQLHG